MVAPRPCVGAGNASPDCVKFATTERAATAKAHSAFVGMAHELNDWQKQSPLTLQLDDACASYWEATFPNRAQAPTNADNARDDIWSAQQPSPLHLLQPYSKK